MAKAIKRPVQIPWGLSPKVLLFYYWFVCAMSGYLISATESMKRLMRMRGIFSEGTADEQEHAYIEATNLAVSFSIVGALIGGILNDNVGPKFTAVLGQLCSALGFFVVFFSPTESFPLITLGCCLIGFVYSCVSISHTSIATLFPGNASLAITALCVGNDLSLGVPIVLHRIAGRLGIQSTALIYCGLNLVLAFFDFFLVPSRPFASESLQTNDAEQQLEDNEENQQIVSAVDGIDRRDSRSADFLESSVWVMMSTYHYIALTLFTCFNVFRKNHYAQFVAKTNFEVARVSGAQPAVAERITEWFMLLLPLSVLASLLTGSFTNYFGIYAGILLVNTWGALLYFACSLPVVWLQWLAIFFYDCFSSFIFGLVYAYLGGFFGFETLGVLQAGLKLISGCVGTLINPWSRYVEPKLPSILWANRIILAGSILAYALPITMMLYPFERRRTKSKLSNGIKSDDDSLFSQRHSQWLRLPDDDHTVRQRVRQSVTLLNAEVSNRTVGSLLKEPLPRDTGISENTPLKDQIHDH